MPRRPEQNGQFLCANCKQWLSKNQFHKRLHRWHSYCKLCRKIKV